MMKKWPLGVFASIDAGLGVKLEAAHELGVPTIQLHAPAKETRTADHAERFLARLDELGMTVTAVFGGFAGESYADIPATQRTVGLVPPETRAERAAEMKEIADFAGRLGCRVAALHIGFVPHDPDDPLYAEVVAVARDVCEHCRRNGQDLHLETGQETADELLRFIDEVGCDNLFVNFDPANMILYGTGEPVEALEKIGPRVHSVHCKDARWADHPGQEWGTETPLGEGDVNVEEFLRTLDRIGYTGPLTIEREIPQDPERQKAEIGGAVRLLTEWKARISR